VSTGETDSRRKRRYVARRSEASPIPSFAVALLTHFGTCAVCYLRYLAPAPFGPTPRTSIATWDFTIRDAASHSVKWS